MADLYRVDSPINREQRNNLNETFKDIQDQIGTTFLNVNKVKDEVGGLQEQINVLVVDGDSSPEAAQARVGYDGEVYPTLKTRIDDEVLKLNEDFTKNNYNVINVDAYGDIGQGGNDTQVFLDAINSNLDVNKFKIPKGKFLVNLNLPRYIELIGDGMFNTELQSYDNSLPTLNLNKTLNTKLTSMTISTSYEATSESIVDATDCRYLEINDVYIRQRPNASSDYSYSVIGLDNRNVSNSWCGYTTIKRSRFSDCSYGLKTGTGLNSMLHIIDSMFWRNGYFGAKLEGVSIGSCDNTEFNGNGKIGEANGNYDVELYGGVFVSGSNFDFKNIWFESNRLKGLGKMPNNFFVADGSKEIKLESTRFMRNNNNILADEYGRDNYNLIENINDGTGKERIQNLISNGDFNYWDSETKPTSWTQQVASGSSVEKVETGLPVNNLTGAKVYSGSAGIVVNYQTLIPSTEISKYNGSKFTLTAYIKASGGTNIRIGFDTGTGNPFFSTGVYYVAPSDNIWTKIVVPIEINSSSGRLLAGFALSGVGGTLEICGVSVSMSDRVNAHEPKVINENGGNVLSQNFMIGNKRHGFGSAVPTSGAWSRGDRVYNINPSNSGIEGWICTVTGTPGTWKTFGTIQA